MTPAPLAPPGTWPPRSGAEPAAAVTSATSPDTAHRTSRVPWAAATLAACAQAAFRPVHRVVGRGESRQVRCPACPVAGDNGLAHGQYAPKTSPSAAIAISCPDGRRTPVLRLPPPPHDSSAASAVPAASSASALPTGSSADRHRVLCLPSVGPQWMFSTARPGRGGLDARHGPDHRPGSRRPSRPRRGRSAPPPRPTACGSWRASARAPARAASTHWICADAPSAPRPAPARKHEHRQHHGCLRRHEPPVTGTPLTGPSPARAGL